MYMQKRNGFALFPVVVVMVILGISFPFYLYYDRTTLSFDVNRNELVVNASPSKNSEIIRIKIDSLGIDLPVQDAEIIGGHWKFFKDSASHLAISKKPFDGGNIVIFARNKEGLFDNLQLISRGDKIDIITTDGYDSIYEVVETTEIASYQSEYITPKENETLTVFTDSGLFSTKRFVVVATPVN